MSRFYGTVVGQRGPANRCGHSGLCVQARSYSGDIRVTFSDNEGADWVSISAAPHDGYSDGYSGGVLLYAGPVADLLSKDARRTQIAVLTNLCGEFLAGDKAVTATVTPEETNFNRRA